MAVMNDISKQDLPANNTLKNFNKLLDNALQNEPEAAYLYYAKGLVNVELNNNGAAMQAFQNALK